MVKLLLETNKHLVNTHFRQKRLHSDNHRLDSATQARAMPYVVKQESDLTTSTIPVHSQSDYPNITYWTKEEWTKAKSKKKDSSNSTDQAGPRGRMRCAQRINVTMMYIQELDRRPITGKDAEQIREFARSLWKEFYKRNIAPKKWSEVPIGLLKEYMQEIEHQWPVLGYCNNYWKSHYLATKNYLQWFKAYDKRPSEASNIKTEGPARRQQRTNMLVIARQIPRPTRCLNSQMVATLPHCLGSRQISARDL